MISGNLAGFVSRLKAATALVIGPPKATEAVNWSEFVTDHKYFLPPPPATRSLLELYNTSPRVRSIVAKVSRAVAKQPWYLEGRDGKRIDDHPCLDFIHSGSPKLGGRKSRMATVAYMDLVGEAIWVIGRENDNPRGKPIQYAPIPPHWVMDVPDDLENGTYKVNVENRSPVEIPARDVLMFRDPDLLRPYGRGSSLTRAAHIEIGTDAAAASYLESFFKNSARPDYILSGSETAPLGRDDRARLETYLGERHRGALKSGRPMVSSAPMHVHEMGKGLRENEVVGLRAQLGSAIFEHYGVSAEIFGQVSKSNRATIGAADFLFATHTLNPRLEDLHDYLEPFCDAEFNLRRLGLKLRYESPVTDDIAEASLIMSAFPNDFTRNEKRKLANLPPTPDGDDLPPPASEQPPAPTDPSAPQPEKPKPPKPGKSTDAVQHEKVVDEIETTPYDDTHRRGATTQSDTETAKEATHVVPHVTRSLSADDVIRVSAAHRDPLVTVEATALLDRIFTDLLAKYGSDLLAELESATAFEISVDVANFVKIRAPWLLAGIDATTEAELAAALLKGAAANENVAALLARIDAIFAAASDTRSALIGQTEATAITGFGSQAAAKQAGFTEKEWLSSRDQIVRDTHTSLDGQRQPINETFKSPSGAQALHPGAFGVAKEDINCRCAMRPVLPGETRSSPSEKFHQFHDTAAAHVRKRMERTATDLFAAQCAVVKHALRRALGD